MFCIHAFLKRNINQAGLVYSVALIVFAFLSSVANGQFGDPSAVKAFDASALHPPAGARLAIVEFADLECPACAHVNPILKDAVAQYKIPWVRHDFLIPNHLWSPKAAVYARWFDIKSKVLGDEYRDQIFANQSSIYNLEVLRQFTDKFAQDHRIALPFAIDPQGKLASEVNADNDLGRRIGITQTPTIFIVTANQKEARHIKVEDPDRNLYRAIDEALQSAGR